MFFFCVVTIAEVVSLLVSVEDIEVLSSETVESPYELEVSDVSSVVVVFNSGSVVVELSSVVNKVVVSSEEDAVDVIVVVDRAVVVPVEEVETSVVVLVSLQKCFF